MVVKPEQYDAARDIPKEITLSITTERRKHVGAFLGSIKYKREHVILKVNESVRNLLFYQKLLPSTLTLCIMSLHLGINKIHHTNDS